MKREFLTGELGLSKEITEKIMAQYGESVNSLKKENERLIPENLLYKHLYEAGAEGFKSKLSHEEYKEVKELLSMMSDMITVNNIYRIKKYYPDSEEAMILHIFSSSLTRFTPNQLSALKKVTSAKEFTRSISETAYKGLDTLFESPMGALFTKQYIYNVCKKRFIRTSDAALSALCYSTLVSTEADNLISIAEGISLGTEPERICSMLIK